MPRKNKKPKRKNRKKTKPKPKAKKISRPKKKPRPKRRLRPPKRLRPKRRLKPRKKFRPKKPKKSKTRKANGIGGRTYYGLNPKFEFSNELKNLMFASPPASLSKMAKKISSLGRVKLALVSGVFLNKENVADLLVVGDDVDRRKFKNFLKSLEAEIGTQIIFAIMDKEEFNYRRSMFDRFVRLMLEGPHEILIDKIGL